MKEDILKVPYAAFNEDWDLLQKFLKMKGNPKYIILGNIDLNRRQDISDLGNLIGVIGNLYLNYSSIESLGELEFVDGNVYFISCENIKTLGKLKRIVGDLYLTFSPIQSTGNLEEIDGNLFLIGCLRIKTLGNIKKISGSFNLEYVLIESLGELEFIGFDFDISNCYTIKTLSKLNYVGRDVYFKNTNIPISEIDKVNVIGNICLSEINKN
jgi:hypothetical protein